MRKLICFIVASFLLLIVMATEPVSAHMRDTSVEVNHYNPISQTVTPVKTTYQNQVFMGYHPDTPSWSKATSYSLTSSRSVTFSQGLSSDGLSVSASATLSSGVTTNISANSRRYSRLGFYVDFKLVKSKVTVYNRETRKTSTHYILTATPINTYIRVKYQ